MLYRLARPLLFRQDPEEAHEAVLHRLAHWRLGTGLAQALLAVEDPRLEVRTLGLRFPGPLGLAAGLDKHGTAVKAWSHLGFGFVEVGTVPPRAQPGNPRPRLFRLPEDRALINRMGFNSPGADVVRQNLSQAGKLPIPLGINIGKNKDTPNEQAADDHDLAIERLRDLADYLVINLSSPNTPDLRALQQPAWVRALVRRAVQAARGVPVLVKLAPDFGPGELEAAVDAALEGGVQGFVVSNTTLARPGLRSPLGGEAGGLSGRPLQPLALQALRRVRARTQGRVPIVGVGGIATGADAWQRLLAGADLLQVYTALIYEGPGLPGSILRGLLEILARHGVSDVAEVVGQGDAS